MCATRCTSEGNVGARKAIAGGISRPKKTFSSAVHKIASFGADTIEKTVKIKYSGNGARPPSSHCSTQQPRDSLSDHQSCPDEIEDKGRNANLEMPDSRDIEAQRGQRLWCDGCQDRPSFSAGTRTHIHLSVSLYPTHNAAETATPEKRETVLVF